MGFRELLGKRMLFFDGATGTELQARGLKPGELTESWNFTHPEIVEAVHRGYLDAGADIIKTNTFGANPVKLAASGLDVASVVRAGVDIARRAVAGRPEKFVALDIGPTGKLLAPYGDLRFEEAVAAYGVSVRAGAEAGADLVLIETMSDTYEIKAAVLAAKDNCDLPICVTMTFDADGKLLTGASVEAASVMCEGLGVDAVGFNCGLGPEQVEKLLPRMLASVSIPVIINPNAGMPVERGGRTCFDIGPDAFSGTMRRLAIKGASIVGGCCGTTPRHIEALTRKCVGIKPSGARPCSLTAVSSYGRLTPIGEDPVIVGECVNPAGRKRLREALDSGDMDYVCRLALEQVQAGAGILDINVGGGPGEAERLEAVVRAVQAVTDVPLAIDTSNPEAMERALRAYNGKAMLNSVSAGKESLERMLPVARKYGAVVVGLCLDENGISESANGRLAAAEKIGAKAISLGIASRDLVFDPLALPAKSGGEKFRALCEALRLFKAKGLKSIAGVSNISFGRKDRSSVNRAALAALLDEGLTCAIVNPIAQETMDTYYGYRALSGLDGGCKEYVSRFSAAPKAAPQQAVSDMCLYDAIVLGLQGEARRAAAMALKEEDALDVINKRMIPALDFVGTGFEKKTLFLPQLLMSADAAKAAFEVIKDAVGAGETGGETVIIATVRGDIHDIGKNIVKVLLENYGYRVLDLGKDVPAEEVVRSAKETGAKVVGLSALMTTTVGAMKETIIQLRRACDCKIVVGGAVLTREYADAIGAEHYAPNAVSAVSYVNGVFGK